MLASSQSATGLVDLGGSGRPFPGLLLPTSSDFSDRDYRTTHRPPSEGNPLRILPRLITLSPTYSREWISSDTSTRLV